MNTEELYNALKDKELSKKAKAVLLQTDWFTVNAVFDPRSGAALPQTLSCFLQKLAYPVSDVKKSSLHDRLWRITEHARGALEHLVHALNENPQREHALLPIRAAKELDAGSFIKLSQRPGRNIREKLSEKPYLQAVRRFQSVDLPENRLLKAFAVRLRELLNIRKEYLDNADLDPLLTTIDNWLRSDEALHISRWDNLPPNNTLLSHRDYRRIWDAWSWLQSLDEYVDKDYSAVESRQKTIIFWQQLAYYRFSSNVLISEIPLLFDYDNFNITTWKNADIFISYLGSQYKIKVNEFLPDIAPEKTNQPQSTAIEVPVCVDLSFVRPKYSTGSGIQQTTEQFAWQQWSAKQDHFDFVALNSSALVEDDSVNTVVPKAFFSNRENADRDLMEQAAFAFAKEWHKVFHNKTLIWLSPDILSDFEMETIRRNINSVFEDAQPLPRSIAAVCQFVDFSKIRSSGFPVVVLDRIGGMIYASKLIAKFDPKLKEIVPETQGYVWERYPSKLIDSYDEYESEYDSVSFQGRWHLKKKITSSTDQYNDLLKKDPEFGNAYYVNLTNERSPVIGGIKLFAMQQRAGEIPLWYDHLPELSTRIGLNPEFYFVKNEKISPQRGHAVRIPIADHFCLPANIIRYEFPLFRGSGSSKMKYMAVLTSRDFPFTEDVQCHLEMFYTYGADNPYSLYFVPENASGKRYAVQWVANEGKIDMETLPVPIFPPPHCWHEYSSWPCKNGSGVSNLFDQIKKNIRSLDEYTNSEEKYLKEINIKKSKYLEKIHNILEKFRNLQRAKISSPVKLDKNNNYYCFVHLEDGQDVFVPLGNFKEVDSSTLYCGQEVWVYAVPGNRGYKSLTAKFFSTENTIPPFLQLKVEKIRNEMENISSEQLKYSDQIKSAKILKRIQYPIKTLWGNGRSLCDSDVPNDFRSTIVQWFEYVKKNLNDTTLCPELQNEIMYLCCCMHQDCPSNIVQHFANLDDESFIKNHWNITMLIGAGNLSWQKKIFERLIKLIPQFNFLLRDLSNILWRTENIVYSLSDNDCNLICSSLIDSLTSRISRLHTNYPSNQHEIEQIMEKKHVSEEIASNIILNRLIRPIVYNLEILLALLRLRKQKNLKLSMDLIPNKPIYLNFLDCLRKLSQILKNKEVTLKTRLAMNMSKPGAFNEMPDLLYAVYMYLTGDSGANTICINSIAEEDEEQDD